MTEQSTRGRRWIAVGVTSVLVAGLCATVLPSAAQAADSPFLIADADASPSTVSLRSFLEDTADANQMLFGHQNAFVDSVNGDTEDGDVFNSTGAYPAIAGLGASTAQEMIPQVEHAYARGVISTIEDHMPNFTSGGGASSVVPTVQNILPGGKDHAAFQARLDMLAEVALGSVDSSGNPIPIIFRPYHENSGSWFWWGVTNTTKSEFIDLWRYTVEYLRDVKDVHNLLYAYSPNGHFTSADEYLQRWPGDEYVDIVGFDSYYDKPTGTGDAWWNSVAVDARVVTEVAKAKSKVAAATEIGVRYNGSDGLSPAANGEGPNADGAPYPANAVADWYTRVADLFTNDPAIDLAYMMTWRDQPFDQSVTKNDTRHFWVPYVGFTDAAGTVWPDHEMLGDFRDFHKRESVLFADELPADVYSRGGQAAAHSESAYLFSPRNSNSQTYTGSVVLQAKAFGDVSNVAFNAAGKTIAGSYNSASGYWEATWDTSVVTTVPAVVKVTVTFADGTVVADQDAVKVENGGGIADPGLLDDFESYPDNTALTEKWQRNVNGGSSAMTLIASPSGEGNGTKWDYDATGPGYTGISRSVESRDWLAAGEPVKFDYQASVADDSVSFQVSTAASGVYSVYLKDVPGFDPTSSKLQHVSIPLDLIKGVDWSNPATPTLSGQVTGIAFYSGKTGSTSIDTIRLGDAPVVETPSLEDFDSYADTAALAEVWQRNVNGGPSSVSLIASPTGDDNGLKWDYDATGPGYTGIARSVPGRDWTAAGEPIVFDYQASVADDSVSFQVSTAASGVYSVYLKDVPGFDPTSSKLQHVSIPLDLIKGVDWSNPATPTLSGQVTGIAFYSGKTGSTSIDTIRLGDAPIDTSTTVDDFESYSDASVLPEVWQRNVNGGSVKLGLVDGLDGDGQAMRIDYTATDPSYAGISRVISPADWLADGLPVQLLLQRSSGSTGDPLVQVQSSAGTFSAQLSSVPGYDPNSTAVQKLIVPLDLFLGQGWSNPATPTLSGEVRTFDIYIGGGAGTLVVDDIRREAAPADTTAPVAQISVPEPQESGWHTSALSATITATDDGQIGSIEYAIGAGEWQAYSAPVQLPEGESVFSARATDQAGNVSETVKSTVKVDTGAPRVSGSIGNDRKLTVTGSDTVSGIARVEYRIDAGQWKTYSAPVGVPSSAKTVDVRATDVAGNASAVTPVSVPVAKASSTTIGIITPLIVKAGKTVPKVSVLVTSLSTTKVTGDVTVTVKQGTTVISETKSKLTAGWLLGTASVSIPKIAKAGTYTVEIAYSGADKIAASRTNGTLKVLP